MLNSDNYTIGHPYTTVATAGIKATNPYLPELAIVRRIIDEAPNIKSFEIFLEDKEKMKNFHFEPGQVGQLSVFGVGEATFALASTPTCRDHLLFSVMRTGEVTKALHDLSEGDQVGVRAPLGNNFPLERMKKKNVLLIGGGIGIAPLRSLVAFILDHRREYEKIKIIYGARTPRDLCYGRDLRAWQRRQDLEAILTIDREFPGWEGKIGFVPAILKEEAPSPKDTIAVTCGPPIMIKFVLEELAKLGFEEGQIITTLERRMKCGIGLCGRCNIGDKYVCVDGPVFTAAQLKELPKEL